MISFKEYCYVSVFVWLCITVCILLSDTDFVRELMIAFTLQALFHLVAIWITNTQAVKDV